MSLLSSIYSNHYFVNVISCSSASHETLGKRPNNHRLLYKASTNKRVVGNRKLHTTNYSFFSQTSNRYSHSSSSSTKKLALLLLRYRNAPSLYLEGLIISAWQQVPSSLKHTRKLLSPYTLSRFELDSSLSGGWMLNKHRNKTFNR